MEQNLKEIVTDEISIERVTNIKYLGVIIDEKLNWNMHVNLCAFQGLFDWCKANQLTISVAITNFVISFSK